MTAALHTSGRHRRTAQKVKKPSSAPLLVPKRGGSRSKSSNNQTRSVLGCAATIHTYFRKKGPILFSCLAALTAYAYFFLLDTGTGGNTDINVNADGLQLAATIGGLEVVRVGRRRWMPRTNVTELLVLSRQWGFVCV